MWPISFSMSASASNWFAMSVPRSPLASVTYNEGTGNHACNTTATCNKPLTTTSANGWVTNYTWNGNGTLSSVKLPGDVNGKRPTAWTAPTTAPAQEVENEGTSAVTAQNLSNSTLNFDCLRRHVRAFASLRSVHPLS